jgi:thiol-disulfide isomerase/thioredoxin
VAKESQPLLGEITSRQLLSEFSAFEQSYQQFQPGPEDMQVFSRLPEGVVIKVFFGTWCHDSEREVGRFLKLQALSQARLANVWLYGLDYYKKDPDGLAEKYGVQYTPTFIIYWQGREVGRIVERPKQSLAIDIKALLDKDNSFKSALQASLDQNL